MKSLQISLNMSNKNKEINVYIKDIMISEILTEKEELECEIRVIVRTDNWGFDRVLGDTSR